MRNAWIYTSRDVVASAGSNALDTVTDWSSQLSVGEQQRLAFARILLSSPQLLLMDESTSALDITNEQALYKVHSALVSSQSVLLNGSSVFSYCRMLVFLISVLDIDHRSRASTVIRCI